MLLKPKREAITGRGSSSSLQIAGGQTLADHDLKQKEQKNFLLAILSTNPGSSTQYF